MNAVEKCQSPKIKVENLIECLEKSGYEVSEKGVLKEAETHCCKKMNQKAAEEFETVKRLPLIQPICKGRPLVLSTHLVPSLPIALFERFAEAIESATSKQVVILHESRYDRPVAEDFTDIALLPAESAWSNGKLLNIGFVFEHELNKTFSPGIYADVVVATDRSPHAEKLLDLRGHRCAMPDRSRPSGVIKLLFNYLREKGEGPAFFGNILDSESQVAGLRMISEKQVESCVIESPVLKCHRQSLPGVYSLFKLTSLGPLPPYQILVHKNMPVDLINQISKYLLDVRYDKEWIEKLSPFGLLGFAEYCRNLFDNEECKPIVTSVPYY